MTQKPEKITKKVPIIKYSALGVMKEEDTVIVEYPLTIYLNDTEWITLLCSGENQYYLAVGFMYSESIIKTINDIDRWHLKEEEGKIFLYVNENVVLRDKMKGKRTITTGCGKGTVFYDVLDSLTTKPSTSSATIKAETIIKKASEFQKRSKLFIDTGGVHACALYLNEDLVCFHEDIGRHNALDKIIGQVLTSQQTITEEWLLVSGRISSEIVLKASRINIGVLVSRSAPTDLAIEIATNINLTIIGFARGNRFNLYTGNERVLFERNE